MSKYDDLFDEAAADDSVFADKRALDPLAPAEEVYARSEQERTLAEYLAGIEQDYLPTTISVYGPPGTGKTLTTRRVCAEFAARHDDLAVEYVNLKECGTLFSAANEILYALTGEKKGAYEGLDGVFTAIWTALEEYPEWTVLLLDEIDQLRQDSNYDPNDFFYRLLRGEGKLARNISLSVWLLSNELIEVDLRLDSRVQSAVSGEQVFFPPYDRAGLREVLAPRLERAFHPDALPEEVIHHGVTEAARRWGDARKALRLFRQAGEHADHAGRAHLTEADVDASFDATEREETIEKLLTLPVNHFHLLFAITSYVDRGTGEIAQPVTTTQVREFVQTDDYPAELQLSDRAIRDLVTDLETMGLVETWIDNRGNDGRVKHIETTFEPEWVREAAEPYVASTPEFSELAGE